MADYDFGNLASPSKPAQNFDFGNLASPASTAAAKAPEQSTLKKVVNNHPSIAAAETVLNLGTGSIAAPVSGLAGIGAGIAKGLGFTDRDPADVVRNVGGAMTYEPRSELGKQTTDIVTKPFQWLAQGADAAGGAVSDATGSPFLGAAVNTGIQGLPALAGKVLKKPAATRLATETERLQKEQVANAGRDQALKDAKADGYVFPPSVSGNQGPLSGFFQGVAGSSKLDYGASVKNQRVTNKLIKEELGISGDEPISRASLDEYRATQGEAYKAVKAAVPELKSTQQFKDMLKNTDSQFKNAKKEFPELFKNKEIESLTRSLSKDKFTSDAAIEVQKKLRNEGYTNMKAFDDPAKKALGEAQINAARAIDNLIDENLQMQAPPGVNNFQSKLATNLAEARKRIAQSYAVEKALNESTGNVSARTLAKMWEKDQQLTGGLEKVAKTNAAFRNQLRDVDKLPATATEKVSNLDVAKATGLAAVGHGTLAAAGTLARPAVKPLLLSDWYQNKFVQPPSYTPGLPYTLPSGVMNNPLAPLGTIPRPPQEQQ